MESLGTSEKYPIRSFVLGWPTLITVWCYFLWFLWSLWGIGMGPVVHSGASSIDQRWMNVLLPAMYVPTIVVFAYCNWLGWKFFQHN